MFARRIAMVVFALLFITARSSAQDDASGKSEPKGSYSVLSWLTGGNLTDEKPPSERRIATERPDFSFATTTVGKGRVALETGYSYFYDRNQGETTRLNSYPEALLRIGLFTEWFEVQFGQSVLDVRREVVR